MRPWGPAPRLGEVTGAVELAEVYGAFGPASAVTWVGACVGGCGARPGCRADEPAPECSGCARRRHGIADSGGAIGRIGPVPARVLPGELDVPSIGPSTNPSSSPPSIGPRVLRSGVQLAHDDPTLPGGLRAVLPLAPAGRLTGAVAHDERGMMASVALRVAGVGWIAYRRREGGAWELSGAVLLHPHLRPANVGQFRAALAGEPYVPPAPRPAAPKGPCSGCGAEVSLTKDGKIYASHKCRTTKTEGRS